MASALLPELPPRRFAHGLLDASRATARRPFPTPGTGNPRYRHLVLPIKSRFISQLVRSFCCNPEMTNIYLHLLGRGFIR